MAKKKQTRRSISISGATFDRLKEYCVANNRSMSSVVEELAKRFLGDEVTEWVGSTPTPPSRPAPSKPDPGSRGNGNVRQF